MPPDPTQEPVRRVPAATPASLAESLAPSPRVLLLAHARRPDTVEDDPALELADAIGGRGRPTLFLDLVRPRSVYAGGSDDASSPGLSNVLRGEATFADVTVRDPRRAFMYVPRGRASHDVARLVEALADSPVPDRARGRGVTVLVSVLAGDLPTRTDGTSFEGTSFDAAVLIGDADLPEAGLGGDLAVRGRLPDGTGSEFSRAGHGTGRAWPRSDEAPSPPASRSASTVPSEVVVPAATAPFRASRPNWWFVLGICLLSAAVGMSVLSALSEDSWFRNLYRDAAASAATGRR